MKNSYYITACLIWLSIVLSVFLIYEESFRSYPVVKDLLPWVAMSPLLLFGTWMMTTTSGKHITSAIPNPREKMKNRIIPILNREPHPESSDEILFSSGDEYVAFYFETDNTTLKEIVINYAGKMSEQLVQWQRDQGWTAFNLGKINDTDFLVPSSRFQNMDPSTPDFNEVREVLGRVCLDAKHLGLINNLLS